MLFEHDAYACGRSTVSGLNFPSWQPAYLERGENCTLCVNPWRNLQDMRKFAAGYGVRWAANLLFY